MSRSAVVWEQLFGRTDRFALRLSLRENPDPDEGDSELRPGSWGAFELWVAGRCLTEAHHQQLGTTQSIEWYLLELLRWLAESWAPMLAEQRLPHLLDRIGSAAHWAEASLYPTTGLLEAEERRWYADRLSWWNRHALRAAADGGCFPNVYLRRVGVSVECSWDNEAMPPCHPGVEFTHAAGRLLLPVDEVAPVLAEAGASLARRLCAGLSSTEAVELLQKSQRIAADSSAVDLWLVTPGQVAVLAPSPRPAGRPPRVSERFGPATLLLSSSSPALTDRDREVLCRAVEAARTQSPPAELPYSRSCPAASTRPYEEGYDLARELREALGWGTGPAPRLDPFLAGLGIRVVDVDLDDRGTHGFSIAGQAYRPTIGINRRSLRAGRSWSVSMLLMHEFCHLLHDSIPGMPVGVLSSTWQDWPTEARANAFAAMLLMPDEGIRATLGTKLARDGSRKSAIDRPAVERLMDTYSLGVRACTWHLYNRKFITDWERVRLLVDFAPAAEEMEDGDY